LLRFTMLYFIACCSFSVIFSIRATMLINLNLNLNLTYVDADKKNKRKGQKATHAVK